MLTGRFEKKYSSVLISIRQQDFNERISNSIGRVVTTAMSDRPNLAISQSRELKVGRRRVCGTVLYSTVL